MPEYFNKAIEIHNDLITPLTTGDSSAFANLLRLVSAEIASLGTIAERVSKLEVQNGWLEFVGLEMITAFAALPRIKELKDPISGPELSLAFQPFRELATEITVAFDESAPHLIEAIRDYSILYKNAISAIAVPDLAEPPDIPKQALESDQTLALMHEHVERHRQELIFIIQAGEAMADAMPVYADSIVREIRKSIVADLERVKLGRLDLIERKWDLLTATVSTAPPIAGYIIDKILEAHGLPKIATEIGLLSSLIENYFLKKTLDESKEEALTKYRNETAILLALVIIPSTAIQVARASLAFHIMSDAIVSKFGNSDE